MTGAAPPESERQKWVLDRLKKQLETLDSLVGPRPSTPQEHTKWVFAIRRRPGLKDRFERWRDSACAFIDEHVSPKEGQRFAKRQLHVSTMGRAVPAGVGEQAQKDREFLVALIQDVAEHPDHVLSGLAAIAQPSPSSEAQQSKRNRNPRHVFVVHGRNESARLAMFAFLAVDWSLSD